MTGRGARRAGRYHGCCSASSFDPPELKRTNTLPRRSASNRCAEQHAHRPAQNLRRQSVPIQRAMDHEARQIHAARRGRPADPFPLRIGRHHGALAAPAGILPHRRHPPERASRGCDTPDPDLGILITNIPMRTLMSETYCAVSMLRTEPIRFFIWIMQMFLARFHPHIPECNSSATQDPHLCCSNRPHPPLTWTLTLCSITMIQEETTTLRHRQSTEIHDSKVLTILRCTPHHTTPHLNDLSDFPGPPHPSAGALRRTSMDAPC